MSAYRICLAVALIGLSLAFSSAIVGTLVGLGYMRSEWGAVAFLWGFGSALIGGFCLAIYGDLKP